MRNSCFKALVLGLALAGWTLGLATQVQAQNTILIPFNGNWRYNDAGASLDSVNWKTNTGYNDSAWKPAGVTTGAPGLFGYEDGGIYPYDILTALDRYVGGASSGTQVNTYYFRTSFNFSGNPNLVTLVATNLLDDGAVVYLNGVELYRYNMPSGAVTYSTVASAAAAEGSYDIREFPSPTLLKNGNNVVAVELHQNSATSSDAVFGLSLAAVPFKTLVPIKQPVDKSMTNIGARFTLSFEVSGTYPQYQWYKNGTAPSNAIPGATQAGLTFNSLVSANTGTYYCIVTNLLGKLTSNPAFLQVVEDTFPPVPLFAVVREADTNRTITLSFNEGVLSPGASHALYPISAINPANYSLHPYGVNYNDSSTAIAFGTSAFVAQNVDGLPSIRIPVGVTLNQNQHYVLKIKTVADARQNRLTNWLVGVSFAYTTNLYRMEDVWDWTYYDYSASNWTATTFYADPWFWFQASGPAFHSNERETNCFGIYHNFEGAPNGTSIAKYTPATYYFRNKFVVPPGTKVNVATLRLEYLLDDGAIFYLNGKEIPNGRINMPASAAAHGSYAASQWEAECRTNGMTVTNMLLVGTNVIAAELHNYNDSAGDWDIFFGAKMDLSVTTDPPPVTNYVQIYKIVTNGVAITTQPRNSTNTVGTTATFSVTATGDGPLRYQWLRNSNSIITGATSATYNLQPVQFSDTNNVYNVVVSNALGSVTSAPVRVYVVQASGVPMITSQPQSRTNTVGTSASFNVTAIGNAPLAYQWRLNNSPIPGATSTSYTLPMVFMTNSGYQYTVVVGNSLGSVTSVVATLTVSNVVGAPVIIVQPQSVTAGVGASAQFSVVASGSTPVALRWRLNNNVISGAQGSSYTVPNVQLTNSGSQYTVIASNSFGSVTSQVATLTVTNSSVAPTTIGRLGIKYSTNSTGEKVAIVTWTNSFAKLQHCSNLTNASSFSDVPNSPSLNYTNVILPGANRFYKLAPKQ